MTTPTAQDIHNAAWDRYKAAEQRIKHDHSPAAQQELKAATDEVNRTRMKVAGSIYAGMGA